MPFIPVMANISAAILSQFCQHISFKWHVRFICAKTHQPATFIYRLLFLYHVDKYTTIILELQTTLHEINGFIDQSIISSPQTVFTL